VKDFKENPVFLSLTNMYGSQNDNVVIPKENLNFLQQLAFPSEPKKLTGVKYINRLKTKRLDFRNIRDPFSVFQYSKKEDTIDINGEVFMKSGYNKIGKKILHTCNFEHDKSLRNSARLKSGSGKLMITNGLSLNEFVKKYNLKK